MLKNVKFFVFVILGVFSFSGIFAELADNSNTKRKIQKLTELQENKLEYYQMEFDSKVSVLNRDLSLKRKLFSEEITKPNDKVDVLLLEQLADEIKFLATTIEQLWIDAELNIRNSMSYEQYADFKLKQENQKTNKKK
ncbi:hypothetical protein MASR1M68_01850 [Elusimicrobiota bacterium]